MSNLENQVELIYNPFAEEKKTHLLIGGREPNDEKSKFAKYSKLNLQSYSNQILFELNDSFMGSEFSFVFTGLENDAEDMREAIAEAQSQGIKVKYSENIIEYTAKDRLTQLEKLLSEVENNSLFSEVIKGNREFAELVDNTFDIFVVATMSSGKSTFINAMLGSNLLPASNEATTATIAEIEYKSDLPKGKYNVSRFNLNDDLMDNKQLLDLTKEENQYPRLLSEWNSAIDNEKDTNKKTGKIHIEANLVGIQLANNQVKLRFSDTPGPNNTGNDNHSYVTLSKIRDTKLNPLIIYVLNGTQLAVNDDNQLLKSIAEMVREQGKVAQDRFIFMINKMDTYFDKKENIFNAIENVKKYLSEKHNIINPKVFPITAELARLLRIEQLSPELLSEDDIDTLDSLKKKINRNPDRDLTKYMDLNSRVKKKLEQITDETLKRTGLPALEAYICDYIEKYNEPHRIAKLTKAIHILLDGAKPEIENLTLLKGRSQQDLNSLKIQLEGAIDQSKKLHNFDGFIKDLQNKEISLSDQVAEFFVKTSNEIEQIFDEFRNRFRSRTESSHSVAEREIKEFKEAIEHRLDTFNVDLTHKNQEQQETTLRVLNNAYLRFIGEFFGNEFKKIDVGFINNLKKQAFNVERYLNLNVNNYKKVKREKIERGFFEKLFSWDWSDKYSYRNVFDLESFFEKESILIYSLIQNAIKQQGNELKNNARQLTEQYCSQLQYQFEQKIADITAVLAKKTDAEKLEQNIAEAEKELAFIDDIQNKVNAIVKF